MNSEQVSKKLETIATKLCTPGCIAGFECGKSREHTGKIPLCGTNRVCPLQKYDVDHSKAPKDLISRLSNEPELDELDFFCEYCEFRDKTKDTDETFSMESCFSSHCIDCPIESCRECIEENIAEALMS